MARKDIVGLAAVAHKTGDLVALITNMTDTWWVQVLAENSEIP